MNKPQHLETAKWLEAKHVAWMIRAGEFISQSAIADLIGIDKAVFNRYYNGYRKPTGENIHKIAHVFGAELYDLLGLARPIHKDVDLQVVIDKWPDIPKAIKEQFLAEIQDLP